MARPAKGWPNYALENLEDSIYRLKQLEREASRVQDEILLGNNAAAIKGLSDVRVMALECIDNLVRARIGKYQQQEKAPRWTRPTDEQAVEAVVQVMATRRP